MMSKPRCAWVTEDSIYIDYHDHEWGTLGIPPRPNLPQTMLPSGSSSDTWQQQHDDYLFEMLTLEGAQAGLSWLTILKRRESYRQAFDHFDPSIVSQYKEDTIQRLLQNKGIIRNELKIRSVVTNAQAFLNIQKEFGSFHSYIWQFMDGGDPLLNDWEAHEDVPASTKESTDMSKDLKKRGFKFVGPTICYAFMQATGMVNDHTKDCFLYHRKQ